MYAKDAESYVDPDLCLKSNYPLLYDECAEYRYSNYESYNDYEDDNFTVDMEILVTLSVGSGISVILASGCLILNVSQKANNIIKNDPYYIFQFFLFFPIFQLFFNFQFFTILIFFFL